MNPTKEVQEAWNERCRLNHAGWILNAKALINHTDANYEFTPEGCKLETEGKTLMRKGTQILRSAINKAYGKGIKIDRSADYYYILSNGVVLEQRIIITNKYAHGALKYRACFEPQVPSKCSQEKG